MEVMGCKWCGASLEGLRADAAFCKASHKVLASRARRRFGALLDRDPAQDGQFITRLPERAQRFVASSLRVRSLGEHTEVWNNALHLVQLVETPAARGRAWAIALASLGRMRGAPRNQIRASAEQLWRRQ